MTTKPIPGLKDDCGSVPETEYDTGFWARVRCLDISICRTDEERQGWTYADDECRAGEMRDDAISNAAAFIANFFEASSAQESKATSPTSPSAQDEK